jgi:hypothetical protein
MKFDKEFKKAFAAGKVPITERGVKLVAQLGKPPATDAQQVQPKMVPTLCLDCIVIPGCNHDTKSRFCKYT